MKLSDNFQKAKRILFIYSSEDDVAVSLRKEFLFHSVDSDFFAQYRTVNDFTRDSGETIGVVCMCNLHGNDFSLVGNVQNQGLNKVANIDGKIKTFFSNRKVSIQPLFEAYRERSECDRSACC